MALINKLQAIANAIRSKTGKTEQLSLDNMVTEIEGIQTGSSEITEEDLTFTGNISSMFRGTKWNWFLIKFKNRIKFKDITGLTGLFYNNDAIEDLSFLTIPLKNNNMSIEETFYGCSKLLYLPEIIGSSDNFSSTFQGCHKLTEITDEWVNKATGDNISYGRSIFQDCYSLRHVSLLLLKKLKKSLDSFYIFSLYYYGFSKCLILDELVGLPVNTSTSNGTDYFYETFSYTSRLKDIIFETDENNNPYKSSVYGQNLDLSSYTGYVASNWRVNIINDTPLTVETEVTDDISYQNLKDNPDWWTTNEAYSRYNHDSAVRTINSLPDTSEYLLANPGETNTIKFKGNAGSKTDGGAINTLTSEEIAVAAAKGWTVTLV